MRRILGRLKAEHYKAMDMRLQGMSFEDIGNKLGKSSSTVRAWFYDDHLFYDTFAQMKREIVDQARTRLLAVSDKAINTLENALQNKVPQSSVQAANSILDRSGLKSIDKMQLEVSGEVSTDIDANIAADPEAMEMLTKLFDKQNGVDK